MKKLVWAAVLAAVAVVPGAAHADGIAFAGVLDGGRGATTPQQARFHYVTLSLPKQTVVTRIDAQGAVLAYRRLPGAWGIPMVAFDGTTAGVSADGQTLVLAQPPIGRMRDVSRFPILRTTNLRPIEIVALEGSFSFDAISPDGSTLYLIEHVSKRDVSRYRVRAYDLDAGRLLPEPIRDPTTGEIMHGYPISRATSADGRWAYTLYQADRHSFVHALDTANREAACVDLPPGTSPEDVSEARLVFDPNGDLLVESRTGGVLAVIDTKTNTLRPEPPLVTAARPQTPATASGDGFPWAFTGAGALLALALLAAVFRAARARTARAAGAQDDGRSSNGNGRLSDEDAAELALLLGAELDPGAERSGELGRGEPAAPELTVATKR